jgi:hypothetical protein
MARLFYLHWNEKEARDRIKPLKLAGHQITTLSDSTENINWKTKPELLIISLDRLPSHGKAVAAVFWEANNRRDIPIIFAGGGADKVKGVREKFPEAIYCKNDEVVSVVEETLKNPPPALGPKVKRVAPQTPGYSGKPLAVKLGVAANQRIYYGSAPDKMSEWVGPLPAGAKRISKATAPIDLAVLFGLSAKQLTTDFKSISKLMAPKGILWMAWPKKAAKIETDVTEDLVRKIGLASEWVDVKICAISDVWSGLKFLRRRKDAKRG